MKTALQTLLEHSEQQRDAAQTALTAAQQHASHLIDQGQQLRDYRADCRSRGPMQPGRVSGIDALRSHQSLLDRIEQALAQQMRQLAQAENQIEQRRQELLTLELRVASVRQLLARRAAMSRQVEARREQHQADDAAQARAGSRPALGQRTIPF